jgi:hypothetical protein
MARSYSKGSGIVPGVNPCDLQKHFGDIAPVRIAEGVMMKSS